MPSVLADHVDFIGFYMLVTLISKSNSSYSARAADSLMVHPAGGGFRSLLIRSQRNECLKPLYQSCHLPNFCSMPQERNLCSLLFSLTVFLDERTPGRVSSRSHSCCTCSCLHTPCTCLPSLFLTLKNPRNSSLKVIFFHQLSPDSSQDDHLSFQREKCMVFFFVLLFPDPWAELFLKVSPISSLIWATVCRLLLRFCSASFHVTQ